MKESRGAGSVFLSRDAVAQWDAIAKSQAVALSRAPAQDSAADCELCSQLASARQEVLLHQWDKSGLAVGIVQETRLRHGLTRFRAANSQFRRLSMAATT